MVNLQFGYKFSIKKMILSLNNIIVELTQKELELVSFLIQNRGFFVSIESLHENVWEKKRFHTQI